MEKGQTVAFRLLPRRYLAVALGYSKCVHNKPTKKKINKQTNTNTQLQEQTQKCK